LAGGFLLILHGITCNDFDEKNHEVMICPISFVGRGLLTELSHFSDSCKVLENFFMQDALDIQTREAFELITPRPFDSILSGYPD
jgi:hypothetical protein